MNKDSNIGSVSNIPFISKQKIYKDQSIILFTKSLNEAENLNLDSQIKIEEDERDSNVQKQNDIENEEMSDINKIYESEIEQQEQQTEDSSQIGIIHNLSTKYKTAYNPEEFVNITDLSNKSKTQKLSSRDIILCMLEITQNSKKYLNKYSNKSKVFWFNIFAKEEFRKIFKYFKPETIKKYWCILSEVKDLSLITVLLYEYRELIETYQIK